MTQKKRTKWNRQHQFKRKKSNAKGVGHPVYIFASSNRRRKYLTFTHDRDNKFPDKVPLQHNIDPDVVDPNNKTYVLPYYSIDRDDAFDPLDKRYRIHKDDLGVIRKYQKIPKRKK